MSEAKHMVPTEEDRAYAREIARRFDIPCGGVWGNYRSGAAENIHSAIYLLIRDDVITYVGQSGDLHGRIGWHQSLSWHLFDRIRILPVKGDRRVRCLVEKRVRDLLGGLGGESVRDRIEMARPGPEVDVETLADTRLIQSVVVFLRWVLS